MHKSTRLLIVILLLATTCVSGCERIQAFMFRRAAHQAAQPDHDEWLTDKALHVILCGTGSPLPDHDRAGGCAAVIANGKFFLFDIGPGAWENVQLWRLPRASLKGIALTHFHSDHIGDLGEAVTQSWIAGRRIPLDVYGPAGVVQVAGGFRSAYAFDATYRVTHHGEDALPPAGAATIARTIELPGPTEAAVIYDVDGVKVSAFAVDHRPVEPAVGYRVDFGGRSVVISGDTVKSENLIRHAAGTDILVHEALAKSMVDRVGDLIQEEGNGRLGKLTHDILGYHTSPVEAAEVASAARAKMLVLTHLVPAPPNRVARRLFLQGVSDAYSGKVVLGEDGMHFILPSGSTDIREEQLK